MLHIEIEELSDEMFRQEECAVHLELDPDGCLRLATVETWDGPSGIYDGLLAVNQVVLVWDLPRGLTASGFLALLAKAWSQLEKVHRYHEVTGAGLTAKGELGVLGRWAQDAVSTLIADVHTCTPACAPVSQFPWLSPGF